MMKIRRMAVLKYHDRKSGRVISKLKKDTDAFRRISRCGQDLEGAFGFSLTDKPLEQKAKLLAEPSLEFGGRSSSSPNNGSWNLQGNKLFR